MNVKPIEFLINELQELLTSLDVSSFVSEFKCFAEGLETDSLIQLDKADKEFILNVYMVESIPNDKNKIEFVKKIDNLKVAIENHKLISSCGWIEVSSEMFETEKDYFVEKIQIIGERR